jgi:hypothetical protein
MFKTSRVILLGALVALIGVLSCDYQGSDESGPQYSSAAEQLAAEYQGVAQPVAVDKVIDVSRDLILESRGRGIADLIATLKEQLRLRGIDGSVLDGIHDSNLGEPLPGVGEMLQSVDSDTGSLQQPLKQGNENEKYMKCPPMNLTGKDSCVQLLDAAVNHTKKSVKLEDFYMTATKKIEATVTLREQPQEFQDYAKNYLGNLSYTVYEFGMEVAAIRAEYTLRHAGLCDAHQIDGKEIARLRGIEDAEKILRKMIGRQNLTLAPKGGECVRIGQTGAQAQARIEAEVKKWVQANPLCDDTNASNPDVMEAEKYRKQGIDRGIKALTTTIWVGTVRRGIPKNMTQYTVVTVDNCTPKDQIRYTTSPLVVDLDGDGLELTESRVSFDLLATGQPQKVTWAGAKEGILALDLDNDGRVTSGRELFGNRSDCGAGRCADGAEALAVHDDNADGRIDGKDPVFKSLRIWVDRNHDGRSQSSELASLADHGIKSLSLDASYCDQRVPAGRITLTLSVETDRGKRTAYDVWFDNLVSPGFPVPLD